MFLKSKFRGKSEPAFNAIKQSILEINFLVYSPGFFSFLNNPR